jgi:hypothetical protein
MGFLDLSDCREGGIKEREGREYNKVRGKGEW